MERIDAALGNMMRFGESILLPNVLNLSKTRTQAQPVSQNPNSQIAAQNRNWGTLAKEKEARLSHTAPPPNMYDSLNPVSPSNPIDLANTKSSYRLQPHLPAMRDCTSPSCTQYPAEPWANDGFFALSSER